eukprot:2960222-Pleurochrysis_carterae.AAC.1
MVALIHTYWIHGSYALGLAEHSNPVLVTHVSRIDFNSAFDRATGAIKHLLVCAPKLIAETACILEKMDEQFNDNSVDLAIAFPSMLTTCLRRAFTSSHVTVPETTVSSPSPACSKSLSAPIATRSHALIAS